ncbi:aspartate aminotransferase family protein [Rhodococcus koreensis]|uniref:aspartate aminotransferase family protein n=1 Tax=Rhodococcus koreensis TaxID=99653 RepID=UPI00366EA3B1
MNKSHEIYTRATDVMPGGTTRATVFVSPNPPYAIRGEGYEVTDEDGIIVIDCNNNYTSLIHGHAQPDILAAAHEAAQHGTAFGLPTRYEVDMAAELQSRTELPHWRFLNSGTEAVMLLIRAARAYTGRDVIIRFDGSYHGTYDNVVDPAAKGIPHAVSASVIVLPQNDIDALEAVMASRGHEVAAVLIDLMPNRAGLTPATQQYVDRLQELTTKYGALLAVDEVISFRLGYGGFHHQYGLHPDLMSLGKVIGGGYPVGAVGGKREVLSSFNPFEEQSVAWGGTFTANPVTMAAGLAALKQFDHDAVTRLNGMGDKLRQILAEEGITANGTGSLVRLITQDPKQNWWNLYQNGILAGTNGLLALSTPMNDELVEDIAVRVIKANRAST